MCNHIYTPIDTKTPGNIGKRCPYSDLYKAAAMSEPLPVDSNGECIFHSKAVEWKRENDFEGHFLKLVNLLNADTTLKSYDFVEFVFVGGASEPVSGLEHAISITGLTFLRQAYFKRASFIDPLVLDNVDFPNGADFGEAVFKHNIKVINARFCGLEFTKAIFAHSVLFTKVISTSYALFDHAQFTCTNFGYRGYVVAFTESSFEGITSFSDAAFNVGNESSIGFLQTRFDDVLDFGRTIFRCQVVFTDVSFAGTTDFTDTLFDTVSSDARHRGSAVEFNQMEVPAAAVLTFASTSSQNKMFNHDVQMSFKEDPAGIIRFENVNFSKIIVGSRNQLTRFAKLGKVEIGAGCIKYRFQTDLRKLFIGQGNAPLVIELCQTFTNYFTVSNGLNLGFEIVDRSKTELSFFYFTDEDISEEIFLDRLAKTEQSLWNLISTKPNLQIFGEEASTSGERSTSKNNALINAVDAISAIVGTLSRASVRLVCGAWTRSDTKALLSAIDFNDDDAAERRAESMHQVILRNYTLVALADINARQHAGLLSMKTTPHTILFLGSNPSDTARLALQREAQDIDDRLRSADLRDAFRIEQQWEVEAEQLPGKIMRFKPLILHFSGHGNSSGELMFQDQHGLASPAKTDVISRLFSLLGDGIKCVVLNACYSSAQAEVIATHVDIVVGMSRSIGDADAIKFAGAFYEALAFGKDVHTSFGLAKLTVDLAHLPDGAVPQMRCRSGVDPMKLFLATKP